MADAATRPKRRFQLVLIKPSHYDDDGYVIQWARAFIPSNTLAVLYSLGRDSAQRAVLGPDTAIDITVIDEITRGSRSTGCSPCSGAMTGSAWCAGRRAV